MVPTRALLLATLSLTATLAPTRAAAERPHAASMLRILGPRALEVLSPNRRTVGALVSLPEGQDARALGAEPIAPGIGRVSGTPEALSAFAAAHPGVFVEVAPPLKLLLDRVGSYTHATAARLQSDVDGTGVLVGVADTGIDTTHADFLDEAGKSRIAWILDYSLPPLGRHAALEQKYGLKDDKGKLVLGQVLTGAEIDELKAAGAALPTDEVGHGTHVTSLAAGNGGQGAHPSFVGVAPKAQLVIVRLTGKGSEAINNDDLVRAVSFLFDRADEMKKPMVVNLSLGSDFGSHDGTMLWEQALASHVGPDHPGRVIVASAGNSGSIVESPVHQSVYVSKGTRMRVPMFVEAASGGVQVWLTMRGAARVDVGLDAPDGTWIDPVPPGDEQPYNRSGLSAGVINGSGVAKSPIPAGSNGAVAIWQGNFPSGEYSITLEGDGLTELYAQGLGAATGAVGFRGPVREGTVNLPATHPAILSVGCTVTRARWRSVAKQDVGLRVPVLDPAGGLRDPRVSARDVTDGEICWFSSAGPTAAGVPKPEIAAPGAAIIGAMSAQAAPGGKSTLSIFTTPACPRTGTEVVADPRCLQVDPSHAISMGTSMSAPIVAGAVALLLQRDPTLTQPTVVGLLQAGAHRFRGDAPFADQSGPGELDVLGALDALDQMHDPKLYLPVRDQSWITLSSEYAAADGQTPLTAIVELRTEAGLHRADLFDPARLQLFVRVNGVDRAAPPLTRRAPGVWFAPITLPPGLGGSVVTVGATFDGQDIVEPKSIPIGTDFWRAKYGSSVGGGCAVTPRAAYGGWGWLAFATAAAALTARRAGRGSPGRTSRS